MTLENKELPEWEREEDLGWFQKNLDVFDFDAELAYEGSGNGAIVVDTSIQPVADGGHPSIN